ncbi:MAG TPA: HEAT repeat domain-containing protein [Vicinamibacterales bacterium]|jgi:hypothetical protein
MADATTLSPDLSRRLAVLARALLAAARTWALYPPEHPAVRESLDRLGAASAAAGGGQPFSFAVTPDTLLVGGVPAGPEPAAIADAARWLHERDVLQIAWTGGIAATALQRLLALLCEDPRAVRQRGGPAAVWSADGDPAITLEQIDFSQVLQDPESPDRVRRKDDPWRAIVRAVLDRRRPGDPGLQTRLLEISGDAGAIGALAQDVIAAHHAADGSPMLTSQAAAVVAAYHHLVGIVDVLSPERRHEVMQNIAAATAQLHPHVVMQMLGGAAIGDAATGEGLSDVAGRGGVVAGIIDALDDVNVAQLLATTLAIQGQASRRLAAVFHTIAGDDERKARVLTLTRRMLSETEFGRQDAFESLWSSMEALLLTHDERPFVSPSYRTGLDGVGDRAERMAADLPADLVALIDTLDQDNVRRLSATLLIDLLTLERDPAKAPQLARDVAALAEDLLLAGDYASALAVATALQRQAVDAAGAPGDASRVALDGLVATVAFHEAADLLGDMTTTEAALFAELCECIGPAAIDALRTQLESEAPTEGRTRAAAIIRGYGGKAASRLAPLVGSARWAAQRNAADLLGDIAAPECVPLLQPLLRGSDARVTTAAVRALAGISDPAAARAIHTVLRAASGEQRRAVVDALVAQRDARVVPVLVRIVEDSDPFGADHPIVLETLEAMAQVGDDQAVAALAGLLRKNKLLARRRVKAVREKSVAALRAIKTPGAAHALDEAARNGDRMLRRLARTEGSQW